VELRLIFVLKRAVAVSRQPSACHSVGPCSILVYTVVVHKLALGQVLLPVLLFSPVSMIPPMLHILLHLQVALSSRTNGRSLGTLGEHWIIIFISFLSLNV
jgi:hypothetical protein